MFRRIESTTKRALLAGLLFLIAVFVAGNVVGILGASNIVWGEGNQYGIVDLPGKKVLHLPASDIDVSLATDILGKGNETVDVPVSSSLALTVTPVDGRQVAVVKRDLGDSKNAIADGVNSQRRVFVVHVPVDADYRVRARGEVPAGELNPQLWFGHGPPLSALWVWLIAFAVVSLGALVLWLRKRRASGRAST